MLFAYLLHGCCCMCCMAVIACVARLLLHVLHGCCCMCCRSSATLIWMSSHERVPCAQHLVSVRSQSSCPGSLIHLTDRATCTPHAGPMSAEAHGVKRPGSTRQHPIHQKEKVPSLHPATQKLTKASGQTPHQSQHNGITKSLFRQTERAFPTIPGAWKAARAHGGTLASSHPCSFS